MRKVIDVRRQIDRQGFHYDTTYGILSPLLRDLFLELHSEVENLDLLRVESEISQKLLFFSYNTLQSRMRDKEASELSEDIQLVQHIKATLSVIDEDLGKDIKNHTALLAAGKMSFDLLWMIFPPNILVYSYDTFREQDSIWKVCSSHIEIDDSKKKWFVLTCNIVRHDGKHFGFAKDHLRVEEFTGAKLLTKLPFYPLQHHPARDIVYDKAVSRGRRISSMEPHAYHTYSAHAIREKGSESNPEQLQRFYTSGRVMISPSAFERFEPDSSYNSRVFQSLESELSDLQDEQYALCSPFVLGFSFANKSWGEFNVAHLQPVDWNDEAFDFLVLSEREKRLIHNLVRQHSSNSRAFDDVIKSKGMGLVGLLAGSPGCGKTLTAEAVAETTHRPLYTITSGELGIDPEVVEYNLQNALELAEMWNAIILIDEAEVFLQQRKPSDLQRNALVAIFLRQLEYYQGIMILTTNMVKECDVAFESRVHFLVHYPDLDTNARRKIWTLFANKANLDIKESELAALAEYKLNGRQIKNAMRTAATLSLSNDGQSLTFEDVLAVVEVLQNWRILSDSPESASN
ncbi:P-loop containing nucleoside triphosphate hydrolase protein [Flagelloscypha sp. PMI_526]|nr:P-loop containing nucleoside triphosphate hydrolase protein [Flagelloscypha sp. PMI_526]